MPFAATRRRLPSCARCALSEPLQSFDPKATYDAASRDYEEASRDYWQYLSHRTVARAALQPGERVLDVPCGTGPALLPAAEAVGTTGSVLGVDYAEQMLAIARDRVRSAGATNIELDIGDMTRLGLPQGSFDAVVCVLGIFFVPDMPATLRSFWDLLRPSGRLAVTVLGHAFFDPIRDVFVEAVAAEEPDLHVVQPWARTEDVATFRAIFEEAGLPAPEIESESERMPLLAPDHWWRLVMGTGLRRTVAALDLETAARVRRAGDAYVADHVVREVVLDAHYALVRKP